MAPSDSQQPEYHDPEERELFPPYPVSLQARNTQKLIVPPSPHKNSLSKRMLLTSIISTIIILISLLIIFVVDVYQSHPTALRRSAPSSPLYPSRPYSPHDLTLSGLDMVAMPGPFERYRTNIYQNTNTTVRFTARDNHTLISRLQGTLGDKSSSIQHILGDTTIACIEARTYTYSDELDVEPAPTQEYPLNQTSVAWNWIVTPKQTGLHVFDISFYVSGKSACATDKDPITGPYLLTDVSYDYSVIDPNATPTPMPTTSINRAMKAQSAPVVSSASDQNFFIQAYNALGIGTIITGALTTLLAAFVGWLCAQWWKRREEKKIDISLRVTSKLHQPGKNIPTP